MSSRNVERNKPCTCKQCGNYFEAVHWNAKTCSPKCRKAYSRYLARVGELRQIAIDAIAALEKYHLTERDQDAFVSIKAIKGRVDGVLDWWD